MVIQYFEPDSSQKESSGIQVEIARLDARKAETYAEIFDSFASLRALLDQRYGVESIPNSSRG